MCIHSSLMYDRKKGLLLNTRDVLSFLEIAAVTENTITPFHKVNVQNSNFSFLLRIHLYHVKQYFYYSVLRQKT